MGSDSSKEVSSAYETFVAPVDSIEVDEIINISEPVKMVIRGRFYDDCSEIARISIGASDSIYNIELAVYGKRRLNSSCNTKEIEYSGSITIIGLSEGRYRVRINGDNNLIRYFSVISGNLEDVSSLDIGDSYDAVASCIEEVAPVESADITVDGMNSARDQKIPYGTPINLIVKGRIASECRVFGGFRYQKIGLSLYVDVLATLCEGVCPDEKREYNETYVITGLNPGSYTLYVNGSIQIRFEVVN